MKLNIFVITLAFAAVSQVKSEEEMDILSDILQISNTCRDQSGITKEDFKELYDYKVTPAVKCFLKCVMGQFGAWNNGLDVKSIMDKVNKVPLLGFISGKLKKVLNECKDVGGGDECEQAFNSVVCLIENVYKDHSKLIDSAFYAFKN